MTKTAVAERPKTNPPAVIDENVFEAHAGAGLENVTSADLLIPRLTLLQALSPQLNKKKPEFIEGAGIGDICDVGTGEVFQGDILFLPVYFEKVWLEWAPRDSGKGLVAIHTSASCLDNTTEDDRGRSITKDGNYIVDTSQFYGFNLAADNRKCFVSFSSTQMKKARKWNTLASSEKLRREDGSEFTPPLFYRSYRLGSAEESNNEGDWAGWTVERGPKMTELDNWKALYSESVAFLDQLQTGKARADQSDLEAEQKQGSEAAM